MRLTALLLAACLAVFAAASGARAAEPVEGVDYTRIADGTPWQPGGKAIEVAEVFSYGCPHCAHFEPILERWAEALPKDVRLVRVPAAFRTDDQLGRAYFAAESMQVLPRTHQLTFDAIHRDGSLPARNPSAGEIAALYAIHGVDAAKFSAAIASPAVDAKMTAAREFARRAGVEGTPTIVVGGVWRVQGRTLDDLLRTTDLLIARERAAR